MYIDIECDEEYQIENRESDGYVDVTNLCKVGGKDFNDWRILNRTFDFLLVLSDVVGIPIASLIKISDKNIWVHPRVAINIGMWISPQFDVKVSGIVMGKLQLNTNYVKQQSHVEYKESNVIYILTTKLLKKERCYILGKAIKLVSDHEVVYYQECPSIESMVIVEGIIFQRLKDYRDQGGRDRFILPKGEHIDMFRNVVRESIEFVNKK
jgi:hypothetical protein